MYVCLCSALTESILKQRLEAGETLAELKRRTRAGHGCGSCDPQIEELAKRYAAKQARRRAV